MAWLRMPARCSSREVGRRAPQRNLYFRDRVLLMSLPPARRAVLRSQSGPHAGAWLSAIPGDAMTTLPLQTVQVALTGQCGPSPGCGGHMDALGDHALACPRSGLLARRARVVERAWVWIAREAVGPEGQVVPQQWLGHTSAPGVAADDRRRCDATLVSPLTRTGQPQPCAADTDGAALRVAERRKQAAYPELTGGGPQRFVGARRSGSRGSLE